MSDLLKVKIYSPEKVIYDGTAKSVSSQNSDGVFDILPKHANFITIVQNQPIKIAASEKISEYTFSKAIIYVHSDQVLIYSAE